MRLKFLSFLAFVLLLMGCEPIIANRGNIIDPDKLAEVKTGISTREEVVATLGTPTMISTFDDKIWFYAGRQTKQYSFLDPEILKQQAIEVQFDDKGVVSSLNKLDLSEAQDISPVERTTPTYGNDDTLIRQLLGNLSHPTPNLDTKREGQ